MEVVDVGGAWMGLGGGSPWALGNRQLRGVGRQGGREEVLMQQGLQAKATSHPRASLGSPPSRGAERCPAKGRPCACPTASPHARRRRTVSEAGEAAGGTAQSFP